MTNSIDLVTGNKITFTDSEQSGIDLDSLVKGEGSAHASRHESGGADEITGIPSSDDIDELSTIITTITSSATPTPVRASTRTVLKITAQSEDFELQNPTGTPVEGDLLKVEVTDDETGRAITYDTDYADGTAKRATTTTASTRLMQIFEYSGSSWKCEHSAEDV